MALPDNEFKDLTLPELRGVARTFNINLDGKTRKADIIKDLIDSGVTWNMYQALDAVDDEPEEFDLLEPIEAPSPIEPVVEPNQVEPEPVVPARPLDPFEELLGESLEDLDEAEKVEFVDVAENVVSPAPVVPEVVVVPVPEPEPEYVVVKMDRNNRTYQVFGYEFTRENPYMLVTADEADVLIEEVGGFRAASSRELREYYGE